jgi:hypothetical protein
MPVYGDPSAGWVPRPLGHSLRRTWSTPGPTCGGYPAHRGPPCIWTFLSNLRQCRRFGNVSSAGAIVERA